MLSLITSSTRSTRLLSLSFQQHPLPILQQIRSLNMSTHPPRGRGRGRPRARGFNHTRGAGLPGPIRGFASTRPTPAIGSQDPTPMASGMNTPSNMGDQPKFSDFPGLSEDLLRSLPFEHCTEVSVLPACSQADISGASSYSPYHPSSARRSGSSQDRNRKDTSLPHPCSPATHLCNQTTYIPYIHPPPLSYSRIGTTDWGSSRDASCWIRW